MAGHRTFRILTSSQPSGVCTEESSPAIGWTIKGSDPRKGRNLLSPEYPHRLWGYFAGVRGLGCEIDGCHPSSPEIKNEWSCSSTHPIRLNGVERDNFTFCILK